MQKQDEHATDRARFDTLTERERDVMRLIAEGYTAPEIGEKLFISPKTVHTYRQRINEQLGLSTARTTSGCRSSWGCCSRGEGGCGQGWPFLARRG